MVEMRQRKIALICKDLYSVESGNPWKVSEHGARDM